MTALKGVLVIEYGIGNDMDDSPFNALESLIGLLTNQPDVISISVLGCIVGKLKIESSSSMLRCSQRYLDHSLGSVSSIYQQ